LNVIKLQELYKVHKSKIKIRRVYWHCHYSHIIVTLALHSKVYYLTYTKPNYLAYTKHIKSSSNHDQATMLIQVAIHNGREKD